MLRRALALLLLAAVLCASGATAVAVTLPWPPEDETANGYFPVTLDPGAVSRAIVLASTQGFQGLKSAQPDSAQGAVASLVRAALRKAPWLGDGQATGLWTWRRNPVVGVAIYGPGIGGYNSFSWTRDRRLGAGADAAGKLRPITQQALAKQRLARRGVGPTPVPLPPAAPMLLLAIGMTALLRRHSLRASPTS